MTEQGRPQELRSLEMHGIKAPNSVFSDLSTPALYEQSIQRREGLLAVQGPLVVRTGQYTGRSPNDRFIVREPSSEGRLWWSK